MNKQTASIAIIAFTGVIAIFTVLGVGYFINAIGHSPKRPPVIQLVTPPPSQDTNPTRRYGAIEVVTPPPHGAIQFVTLPPYYPTTPTAPSIFSRRKNRKQRKQKKH